MLRILFCMIGLAVVLNGCVIRPPETPAPQEAQDAFWARLQRLCGRAYTGTLVQGSPADTAFAGKQLVMHVRQCSDREIRIPFHAGEDRSRTWILTRTEAGLRMK
ncbi:MAG: hypothetical protein M3497_08890, partial [Gemmatimonadota bacterium]|nr:hypothetical protein [Gemmatimonadota bacterium]